MRITQSSRRKSARQIAAAKLSAACAASVLVAAGLSLAPAAAHASPTEVVFEVTTAADYPSGDEPIKGSLRHAFEQVEEQSLSSPDPIDFRINIKTGDEIIHVNEPLMSTIGPQAHSVFVGGTRGEPANVDFGTNLLYVTSDSQTETLEFADVQLSGSSWTSLGEYHQRTKLTRVSLTDMASFDLGGNRETTLEGVTATDSNITAKNSMMAPPESYDFSLTESTLTNTPVSLQLFPATKQNVFIANSTLQESELSDAFSLDRAADANSHASVSIDESKFLNNAGGGVNAYFIDSVRVEHSTFSGNGGNSAAHFAGNTIADGNTDFTFLDNTFANNQTYKSALDVSGYSSGLDLRNSTFTNNSSSEPEAAGAFRAEITPNPNVSMPEGRQATIADTIFNNNSGATGAVAIDRWQRTGVSTEIGLSRLSFQGNKSELGTGDLRLDQISATSNVLISDSLFSGATTGGIEPAANSISFGAILESGHARVQNTTISVPENGRPAVYFTRNEGKGRLSFNHVTLTGGGVLGSGDYGPALRATVFDTDGSPVTAAPNGNPLPEVTDVFTRTASPFLPGVKPSTTEELALGKLADNGGPTLTRLPGEDSVLNDSVRASNAPATRSGADVLEFDQRGMARDVKKFADVGAVERQRPSIGLE